jgi:hypothetical protein
MLGFILQINMLTQVLDKYIRFNISAGYGVNVKISNKTQTK